MTQYETERKLCWWYGSITFLLVVSVVCVAIPFNHWRGTLDVCPGGFLENVSCGCIFYGVSTFQFFNGGHNSTCHYAIFAPLPLIAYAMIMFLYHMFRVCINNVGKYEEEMSTAVDDVESKVIVMSSRARVSRRNDSVIYCWIPTASIAAVFALYNLVHAAIITDGYFKTCNQYRGFLVGPVLLRATGNQVTAIHFRLSCQAIFDYMDYLQPDVLDSRRGDFINTGVALQLALVATWLCVGLWLLISIFTSIRAYKEREVLTCCGN